MTKLRPFQVEGVRGIYNFRGRCLLADEQGCGKTIQALAWIRKIPTRRPVVVVAPASVKYAWQAEAALHFNMRTEVLEGHPKSIRPLPGGVVILNYDILHAWLPSLLKAKVKVVVLDEVHYITNPKAQRSRATFKLTKKADSVVGLSGTPFTNHPIELWSVLKAINPDIFPNRSKYAWRYTRPKYTPWGWTYNGSANSKELRRILRKRVMIRRLKKDVAPELPDKIHQCIPFKLKPRAIEEYQEAQHKFLKWLRKKSVSRALRAARSEALSKVGYLLRLVAELKLEWTTKWVEEFFETQPGEKLVGFTMHTFVIDHLHERFRNRALIIDGRVTGRMRHETVRLFQNSRHKDLLLGNWKAAGVGLNLQVARHGVAFDLPHTPGTLLQGIDRLHRIGQENDVFLHYLLAIGTIEEKQIKVLWSRTKVLDAILNGEADPEDLNFFDELLRDMMKGAR